MHALTVHTHTAKSNKGDTWCNIPASIARSAQIGGAQAFHHLHLRQRQARLPCQTHPSLARPVCQM